MPPLHHAEFFKQLCWRCSIRSTCSKISMSRLFLRSTSLALCQLVKDMKEVSKPIVISRKGNTHTHTHTHTHTFNCKQLRLDGRKWLAELSRSNNSRLQLLTFERGSGVPKPTQGPSKFTGCGSQEGSPWSTQLTWSTSVYTADLIHFTVLGTLPCFMQVPLMSAECGPGSPGVKTPTHPLQGAGFDTRLGN